MLIEITYAGGRLPDEAQAALASAMRVSDRAHQGHRGRRGRRGADGTITVSADPYSIVAITATVRAGNPREALSQLDEALDDALMATGLFEEFDVTGKVLRVGPLDQV
ncbi:MAG TPA: hypothetical protein VGN41_11580, partial [Streptosporangiaceae bacterium]